VDPTTAPAVTAPRRRRPGLAVLLGILALVLGASAWAGLARRPAEPARAAERPATAAVEPVAGGHVLKSQDIRPTHLRIPSIDVSATVTSLGIHADRTVEVPADPDQVGWYRLGARPGQAGSAVLLGHVDSTNGPAVFYRLRALTRGDEVEVRRADGSTVRFVVTSIATYANADFPAQKVYRSRGRPGLALVTCGGRYDAAHGGYQANVVVFAALAGRTASRG
jgi:sortase (surface protein transpeptidase)